MSRLGLRAVARAATAAIFAAALASCSSLLYYPDRSLFADPARLARKPQDVYFQTADGLTLNGWLFRSPARPSKGLIVLFHGNAQNLSSHFLSLYWILEHGYDFLAFDYRGYGRSPGVPSPEGTVIDGRAAIAFSASRLEPGQKLIVFGQSLGGTVALRATCEALRESPPPPIDRVAVESTFLSYRSAARSTLAGAWLTWPLQWVGWLAMSDAHAPKGCVGEIAPRPLLVIHGTADPTVDVSLGEAVFAQAREPKTKLIVEGGGHIDAFFRDEGRHRAQFLKWLQSSEAAERPTPGAFHEPLPKRQRRI